MTSLKQRLSISLAASLILFFVVQSFMISNEVVSLSENNMVSRLQHDQEQILSALAWSLPTAPQLNQAAIPAIYKRPFSGHYFQIDIAGRQFRSRSLWDEQLPAATQGAVNKDVHGPKQQRLLMISRIVQFNGQPVSIRIAEDISRLESSTSVFQRHFLFFAAAAVLALLVLQGWLINVSLRPLKRVRQQLSQLDSGELEQVSAPTPDEITPLVTEVNRLISLMRKRLIRSRHALGDLAHSLKTPLAVARQIAERQAAGKDRTQLDAQLRLIDERIERELVRARTAGPMLGGQWKEVQRDLEDMVRMLERAFPHIAIELELEVFNSIGSDREDMLEILGNLMENACKWGQSTVRCSLRRCTGGGLDINIEDDGPGLAQQQMEQVITRGVRADEACPGHGLGLSIVHEIVHAYEGEFKLSRSVLLHGLQVNIHIP
ncbi:MAG: ATP-binding protein [Mariprofundus sp.]|nr:ATP-binding protein [Mariprofundus sp.]